MRVETLTRSVLLYKDLKPAEAAPFTIYFYYGTLNKNNLILHIQKGKILTKKEHSLMTFIEENEKVQSFKKLDGVLRIVLK